MNKSLGQRLLDGTFFAGVAFVVSTVFNVAINTLCARTLGRAGLGEYSFILDSVVFLQALVQLGAYDASLQYVARFRVSAPERVGGFVLGLIMLIGGVSVSAALLLVAFPDWFAALVLRDPLASGYLRIGVLNLTGLCLANILSGALQGLEAFRAVTGSTLVANLLATPIWIVMGLTWGTTGWLLGTVLQSALLTALFGISFVKICRERGIALHWTGLADALVGIREQGFPLQVQHLTQEAGNIGIRNLLVGYLGPSMGNDALGLIRAGRTVLSFGPLFQKILGYAALPILTESLERGQASQVERATRYNLRLLLLPSIAVTLGAFAALPAILRIWFGEAYVPAWRVSFVLGAAVLVMLAGQIARQPLVAARINWNIYWVQAAWTALLLGSFSALFYRWREVGFGAAYLVAEIVYTVALVRIVRQRLGIRLAPVMIRLGLFLAFAYVPATLSVLWLDSTWTIPLGGATAVGLFLGGFWYLFDADERSLIMNHLWTAARPALGRFTAR